MIRLRTLENGLRVVTEPVDSVRSCGVGLLLEVGSRDEQSGEAGLSHFIEHMLFKGTDTCDWRQIGETINWLGGNINAYTTQEVICLHARTVDRKAPLALEFLIDLLTRSTFPEVEIRRERKVVLEECRMDEDSPEDLSVDRFVTNLWPDHAMGRPVIGTPASIRQFSRDGLMNYWQREFRPNRLIVAIAGAFDAKACAKVVRERLGRLPADVAGTARDRQAPAAAGAPRQKYLRRSTEQTHFCLGTYAPPRLSPDRYAFGLMNMVLGGGMSSRLFQEIREKRGLAYSIGSFSQLFSDRGFWAVSGGTHPGSLGEVLAITRDEIARIAAEEVPQAELDLAREQVLDAMLIGLENTEARMTRLADSLMVFGRVPPIEELIKHVQQVTPAEVRRVAATYLCGVPFAVSAVGPKNVHAPLKKRFAVE